jgi:hypothetical protein
MHSPHPEVAAAIEGWLREADLEWPVAPRFQIKVVDHLPPTSDTRPIFRQPTVTIQAGAPEGIVRIRWDLAEAEAVIAPKSPVTIVSLSHAAVAQMDDLLRTFFVVTLLFMLRRAGWFHVHAGALKDPSGRGWMLIGDSHSGKSTTTALLATQGWGVATDDIAFLYQNEGRMEVAGFRAPIALREGGYALLGRSGGRDLPKRGKTGYFPDELGAQRVRTVRPEVLLYTSLGDGGPTTVRLLRPREVIQELMQWSMWVLFEPERAQEHLDNLAQLGRQAANYRIVLGPDLIERPGLLNELIPPG